MIRIYNVLKDSRYLSDAAEGTELIEAPENNEEAELLEAPENNEEPEENAGLSKAIETYRKLIEKKDGAEGLSEKEQEKLENRIKEIESREVVEKIEEHEPEEIPCEKNKITIGPPTLTRFEKARIMGARGIAIVTMRHHHSYQFQKPQEFL